MKPLPPEWHWESTGTNGGKIVGSCKTPKELGEMIQKLAEHPETEQIRIGKFRRDYDPMIPTEKMLEIINATGEGESRSCAPVTCSDAPDSARNACEACDGKGWYATGDTDSAVQLQCQFCFGTGVRPVQPNAPGERRGEQPKA